MKNKECLLLALILCFYQSLTFADVDINTVEKWKALAKEHHLFPFVSYGYLRLLPIDASSTLTMAHTDEKEKDDNDIEYQKRVYKIHLMPDGDMVDELKQLLESIEKDKKLKENITQIKLNMKLTADDYKKANICKMYVQDKKNKGIIDRPLIILKKKDKLTLQISHNYKKEKNKTCFFQIKNLNPTEIQTIKDQINTQHVVTFEYDLCAKIKSNINNQNKKECSSISLSQSIEAFESSALEILSDLSIKEVSKKPQNLPRIVIYLQFNRTEDFKIVKERAQSLLNKMYELYKNKNGLDIKCRGNEKVTDFLYFSQGNGDLKEGNQVYISEDGVLINPNTIK